MKKKAKGDWLGEIKAWARLLDLQLLLTTPLDEWLRVQT
jgi:hypothetical protein